jgi:hypothetical protein
MSALFQPPRILEPVEPKMLLTMSVVASHDPPMLIVIKTAPSTESVIMAAPKGPLGSTEIEILRYIGGHQSISVGEVAEHVAQTTGQATIWWTPTSSRTSIR